MTLFFTSFLLLNAVFLTLYCSTVDYLENRHRDESLTALSNEPVQKRCTTKKGKIKRLLSYIYSKATPYLYGWMRYWIIVTGHFPSHRIRNFIYRHIFRMKITKRTVIQGGCEIRSPWNIHADNCVIFTGCILDGRSGIIIGNNVVFGGYVRVWTQEHDFNDSDFKVQGASVIIEDRSWICSDSTILPGVHIGKGAVIASKSCVTKNCDDYTVYAGIPARKIADRSKELHYVLSGKPVWHFY